MPILTYEHATLRETAELFRPYPCRWWIVGGWALDLFGVEISRPHDDVDVLVLNRDLSELAKTFNNPRPVVESPTSGARRPWLPGEILEPGPNALVFPDTTGAGPTQILLALADRDEWVFHRGRRTIRRSFGAITYTAENGIPYLAPEVVLLFKSRHTREKDNQDFHRIRSKLNPEQQQWLAERLPEHHAWLPHLNK